MNKLFLNIGWRKYIPFGTGGQKGNMQLKHAEDLKNEIQKLMFSEKVPINVSLDQGRFVMVMSAFFNYEKVVSI